MGKKIDSAIGTKDVNTQTITNKGTTDLNYKLIFLANNVMILKSRFQKHNNIENFEAYLNVKDEDEQDYAEGLSKQDLDEIQAIRNSPNVFENLAKLIAPSVLENIEVKKGILLMLFSGVNKRTRDGMKLRGDINICLVGDPSTAKS